MLEDIDVTHATQTPPAPPLQRPRRPNSRARARKRAALLRRDGPLCNWCRSAPGTTLDHVVPFSKGGGSNLANLVLACQPCNRQRGDLTLPTRPRRHPMDATTVYRLGVWAGLLAIALKLYGAT